MTSTVVGLAASSAATANVSDFNTSLTPLSGTAFQLNQTFSILYDLDVVHLDTNLDNVPDVDVTFGAGDFLGDYLDPENYVIDFSLPGSGVVLKPYFMGSELTAAASVDWRLSYASTPGDVNTIFSTILSGSAQSIPGGLILSITDGLEWPVNGWTLPDVGIPLGTHWAADIADFDSFTFTYPGQAGPATLSANVIPAPGVLALMGLGGLGLRRRRD